MLRAPARAEIGSPAAWACAIALRDLADAPLAAPDLQPAARSRRSGRRIAPRTVVDEQERGEQAALAVVPAGPATSASAARIRRALERGDDGAQPGVRHVLVVEERQEPEPRVVRRAAAGGADRAREVGAGRAAPPRRAGAAAEAALARRASPGAAAPRSRAGSDRRRAGGPPGARARWLPRRWHLAEEGATRAWARARPRAVARSSSSRACGDDEGEDTPSRARGASERRPRPRRAGGCPDRARRGARRP